jgi:hypothetical protein
MDAITLSKEGSRGPKEHAFEEFQEQLVKICEDHRGSGRAMLFAFILYDYRNAQLLKVLRDADYWRALDHLAGKSLTVFTIRAAEPLESYEIERRGMHGVDGPGDPGMKYQLILRSYFGLRERLTLPAVLFFQVHDGEVVDHELWQLQQQRVEDAFVELRDAIGLVVTALEKVEDENRGNAVELFNLVKRRIGEERTKVRILKGLKAIRAVKDITSFVHLLPLD